MSLLAIRVSLSELDDYAAGDVAWLVFFFFCQNYLLYLEYLDIERDVLPCCKPYFRHENTSSVKEENKRVQRNIKGDIYDIVPLR